MADLTFRNFSAAQARAYAKHRNSSYPAELYQTILDYHFAHNADATKQPYAGNKKLDLLLDVGCGPGKVVFDLLPCFQRALGIDPGHEMIEAAKGDPRFLEAAGSAAFRVANAEQCGDIDEVQGGVDVLTVAMAAHWFDMPAFYASAAKALKPGGTLAMWTCSSYYAHPSNPRYEELQAILSNLEDHALAPYATPGNILSRDAYQTLPLPWTLPSPNSSWSETSFVRHDWDIRGVPSAASMADGTPGPFLFQDIVNPNEFGSGLGASSMGARWREANKEKLDSGELEDCGTVAARALGKILGEIGKMDFIAGPSCSLLLMNRK